MIVAPTVSPELALKARMTGGMRGRPPTKRDRQDRFQNNWS